MTLQTGQIIDGKYRIVRLLGEGGMGAVYEGENTRIHRRVAIKVLHAGVAAKADVVQRFEREAQAAGRIGSEHIVEVLDLGNLPEGERYMVMEYLEGESLGDRIKKRKHLPPGEVAPIAYQLLAGLAAAHQAGIIHRDLKPDNVYLLTSKGGQRDFVKVLDFGVSKFSALDTEMSMTRTGAVMGTPYYMSPEQARGAKIDQRSDLYSVGVVLYQAVTGRVPFNAETFNELVFKIALENPEPAENVAPDLDKTFAAIIAKSMTRDAAGRYQSAQEFQQALTQWMMTSASAGGLPMNSGIMPGFPSGAGFPSHPSFPSFPSNPSLSQSGSGLGQSGPALGQSGGGLGQSGLSQSNPNALAQSGSSAQNAQLGASQNGLAMTAPQQRGSGTMIAIGLGATLLLAGGGLAAYKLTRPAPVAPAPTTVVAAPPPSVAPEATAAPTASAEASAAPSASAEATAEPSASAEASAAPAETAKPAATAAVAEQPAHHYGGGKAPAAAKKPAATAAPTAAPVSKPAGGRTIGSQL